MLGIHDFSFTVVNHLAMAISDFMNFAYDGAYYMVITRNANVVDKLGVCEVINGTQGLYLVSHGAKGKITEYRTSGWPLG